MKIINKYIYKEFVIPFFYCFFAFIILFMIGDLFENLDDFIKQKVPWIMVIKYYLFLIPSIFIWTAPLAILLSLLYQLGYMSRHNELNALKASGVSFWRIAVPFITIGIMFSLLTLVINERLVPKCNSGIDLIRTKYIKKKEETNKIEKYKNIIFFSSAHNMSFYVDAIDKDKKNVQAISIREFYDNGSIEREWYADKGTWLDESWWLFNGYIKKFARDGTVKGKTIFFEKYELSVKIAPQDLLYSHQDIDKIGNHMDYPKLRNYIKRNYTKGTLPHELVVDLYRKLSIPIVIIVITLFGVAFGARISKGGALASVGASIAVYLIYYGISSFFLALGKLGRLWPVLAVWFPQMVFGTIGIYLFTKTR